MQVAPKFCELVQPASTIPLAGAVRASHVMATQVGKAVLNAPVTEEPSPVQVVVAEPCKLNPALHVVVQMLPKALSSSQLRPPLTIGAGSGQVIARHVGAGRS